MAVNYTYQAKAEMKSLGNKASRAITASAKGMWKVAVRHTPRDTGTAQAGWKLSNKRRSAYEPVRREQPPPKVPNFRFRVTKDKRIYFWNNVYYVEVLEHGGTYIKPHNMLYHARIFFEKDVKQRLDAIHA